MPVLLLVVHVVVAITDVQPEIWAEVTRKSDTQRNLAKQKPPRRVRRDG